MRPQIKSLYLATISFVISIVFLWPLRLVSPIADDLHLVAQGSGLLRTGGLLHVIDRWSDFSLSSSHLTPFGGVWTAFHVWLTNQLALRTSMTLTSSWGLLRILWIALAIQSALHLARTFSTSLSLPRSFNYLVPLVLLGTIQVHGYWSNDPVISFPVASWAVCVIGFLYLSLVIRSLNPSIWPSRAYPISAVVLAFIGVFTYELFLAFLVAAFCFVATAALRSRRWHGRLYFFAFVGVIVPALILVSAQLLRMSKGSVYGGTEIALSGGSLPKIALIALISSMPLANLKLTGQLLQHGRVVTSQLLISTIVLIAICGAIARQLSLGRQLLNHRRLAIAAVSLSCIWVLSTLLIVVTPKYQSELNGVLGKVYVNYAPSWIAIALLISLLLTLLFSKIPRRFAQLVVVLLLLVGVFQFSTNLRQVYVLQRDSSWSKPLLSLLESPIPENTSRCNQLDILFGLPFPEYYQAEIYQGLQNSYSGTYGVPYCNYENLRSQSPLTMRSVAGLYPIEILPDGRKIIWSNAEVVIFDVVYRGQASFRGELELLVSPPPCASTHQVEIVINGSVLASGSLLDVPITLRVPVTFSTDQKTEITVRQSGSVCSIEADWRTFMTMFDFPRLISPGT